MMINTVGISDYYYFYEDNNRNGLKYNITIDNAIIDLLKNENRIIGSSELRSRIKESMGRKISPDTFYSHLNVLVNHKILDRQDEGRGKGVLYSLTKNAKKMLELNLLGVNWERINLFRRIYEKFFLYEVLHDPLFILRSEQEFDRFLFDLGVKRQNLEWGKISEGRNYDSVDLIYGQNRDFPAKAVPKNLVKKYWRERKGQTSTSEKIEFICFPLRPHNLDVVIYRREYWRINKNSPSGIERIDYTVTLPGVSIHELANDNSHHTFLFERTDIEKAFEQLKQTHLIDRAFWFRGHMRYKVTDENLRNLISNLRHFSDEEFALLSYKWKHFEEPTMEEKKRWKWILGEKEANKFFNEVELIRYENRKRMRQCKNIVEYHKFLNTICPNEFLSPVYGPWPYNDIFYDYIRKREEGKKQLKMSKIDRKKQGRKGWIRTKKRLGTKKEIREDIIKYEQYLRHRLDSQLERLPINLENEGIEHLKMFYRNTIDEYPFLDGIIKNVCPKAFEPDNIELQSAIIHQQKTRDFGSQILARELKAIDFENVYDRKNKKRIPYNEYEKQDPVTGKIIKYKVLNLTPEYKTQNTNS